MGKYLRAQGIITQVRFQRQLRALNVLLGFVKMAPTLVKPILVRDGENFPLPQVILAFSPN